MVRTFTDLDQVRAALGVRLGPSQPLAIDQHRIDAFAEATGDHQWIHVDPARAAGGPFGRTIAHGFLTLSLLPYFGQQLFALEFGTARVNYGIDKVRFPDPVPVDSALRCTATFTELRDTTAGAILTTRYVVHAADETKPACVADTLVLLT
ncbi:MaoC family dehydratase [Nocardia mexicana]|uniref:Acyl dehydratase n=1 Tax=Nocardia mexicana TaxID=279262 RepID=A0A370HGP6_9NOCA|nr:MaoC family dehydratase [Nocardia mexicana]RDI55956.1 acyl dehydratase [Nocardia mexicana]